jgi:hypothetical protein
MVAKKIMPVPTPAPTPKIAPAPVGPKIKPLRVAVMPPGMDRSGAMIAKSTPKPTPAPAPKNVPLRVAVLPRTTPTPNIRKTKTPPTEPLRVLFRD